MTNKEIADRFRQIAGGLRSLGEMNEFRLKAYFVAAAAIETFGTELSDIYRLNGIDEVINQMKTRPGLGEKSRKKIQQFLETGSCPEWDEILKKAPQEQLELIPLPPKTRKGSKNQRPEVTAVRRPWSDADAVIKMVIPVINKYFDTVTVCGSYRRAKATVKDLDFTITSPLDVSVTISQLFANIEKELGVSDSNVIKRGDGQTSFYLNTLTGEWQIDFWYVPESSYGGLVLFNTGSQEFNVGMRSWCKSRGYSLNRYGLFKITGPNPQDKELIASKTEQDIFTALGLVWVPPKDREIGFKPQYIVRS